MNRAASILTQLETALSASPEALAQRFGVSQRTVAADVAQLNAALGPAGSIRLADGRYRLLVVDADACRRLRERLAGDRGSFNEPRWRVAHILARLARADVPVSTEELAAEMRVGRTTVVADVGQLRRELEPFEVAIEGRTRVGLHLVGREFGIRMALLSIGYAAAYRDYPLGTEIDLAIDEVLLGHHLSAESSAVVRRWLTVSLDRHLTGHPLPDVPAEHRDLAGSPAHDFARRLAARLEPLLAERLPDTEVLFLALPAAGMRTAAAEPDAVSAPSAAAAAAVLVRRILDRIADEMDVRLDPTELVDEFAQHVSFMLNRMRYSLHVGTTEHADLLADQFPLAHRMATITRSLIADETSLVMDDGELALMCTYFQVFLEDHAARRRRELSVTIISGRGPASARLIRSQLAAVLPADTRYTVVPDSAPGDLETADLVVTAPGARVETRRPTLELSEVFDRHVLVRRLHGMGLPTHGPLLNGAAHGSLLASLLDESRFVRLPAGCGYAEGTRRLVHRLATQGLVGETFGERLSAREERTTMRLDEEIAFPHLTDPQCTSPACALGVIPRSDVDGGLRLILLLAVPEKAGYDDTILIRVYDEIIRLGSNRAAVAKISRLTSYEQFFYFMENLSTSPTT